LQARQFAIATICHIGEWHLFFNLRFFESRLNPDYFRMSNMKILSRRDALWVTAVTGIAGFAGLHAVHAS
jgi:hypothetical protein